MGLIQTQQFMKKFFVISFLLLTCNFLHSQNTPKSCIENHLYYLTPEAYNLDSAKNSFSQNTSLSKKELNKRAIKLKQIYNGSGLYINQNSLPTNANYKDSTSNTHTYVVSKQFPSIYIIKENGKWVYSKESIATIPQLHKNTYPFGTHLLLDLMPKSSDKIFVGLYLHQYIIIFLLIFFAFFTHKLITAFANKTILKILKKRGNYDNQKFIKPIIIPLSLVIVVLLLLLFLPIAQLPSKISSFVLVVLKGALPFFATIMIYKFIDLLANYIEKLALKTESTLDDQLVPLLRKALKVFVVAIGTLFTLQNLNFNITALLAGISIGGLAFALAAQDMLKNFFGSLMIFVDRPFQVGDWITGNGIDGDIEEVGFRSTRIRTFHNSVISIPNGHLADMTIDNLGMRKYRRYKTYLAVTYDTPAENIDLFVEGLKQIVVNHSETRKDYYNIYLHNFANSSLEILFYIFFEVPTWPEELKARHEINLEIISLAEKMKIRFAFNTQTIHVENFPEKESLTPASKPKSETQTALLQYFKSNNK